MKQELLTERQEVGSRSIGEESVETNADESSKNVEQETT